MPNGMVAAPGGAGVVPTQLAAYNPFNPQVLTERLIFILYS